MDGNRCCKACGRKLGRDSYSNNQWSKGVGVSRCNSCVHGSGPERRPNSTTTERENLSNNAEFRNYDLDHPFAKGGFRWVAKGRYTEGRRKGEECVAKWFKSGIVLSLF